MCLRVARHASWQEIGTRTAANSTGCKAIPSSPRRRDQQFLRIVRRSKAIASAGEVAGKRLFGNGAAPAGLRLLKSRSFQTGVIVANYRPDGAVKTGDFQLAEPTEAELARRRNLT